MAPRKNTKTVVEQADQDHVDQVSVEEPTKLHAPATTPTDIDSAQEADDTDDGRKLRKPRTATNLQTILEALQADNVKKATKLLETYIKKHGVGGQKRRSNKRVDENGEPKPLSAHKLFIQQEMKLIKDEQPNISTQERMKLATLRWKQQKENAST